jgi:hypothetical protein
VSRDKTTTAVILLVGLVYAATLPAAAVAQSRLDYPRAKRLTTRIAKDAAAQYEGRHAHFDGCSRTSPRRMVCKYEFVRDSTADVLATETCFGSVAIQMTRRGSTLRVRAPFPGCY